MYLIKTKIQKSPIEGKGYFADEDISIGTIIYFYGESDERYSKNEFKNLNKEKKKHLLDFAVEDEYGSWVETSSGPFTNHSCNSNILPLYIEGSYVSIAAKNIKKGDEITTDYSLFFSSSEWSMECHCNAPKCRKTIGFGIHQDPNTELIWQERINHAIKYIHQVTQPITSSNDKFAQTISNAIKENKQPTLGKQIKFSLIKKD